MKEMTKIEVIERLIDDDIDTIVNQYSIGYLANILRVGFKGYDNYTKEELYQKYIEKFNEGVNIK